MSVIIELVAETKEKRFVVNYHYEDDTELRVSYVEYDADKEELYFMDSRGNANFIANKREHQSEHSSLKQDKWTKD